MEPRELSTGNNPRVVPATKPYRHYLKLQTRFTDYDMLGHLNNNVYMSFMDLGKAEYFTRVMKGTVDWSNPGVVVVNVNCDYLAPVVPGEELELYTTVTKIGERSMTLDQRIINVATGEVKCVARTVMAGFDMASSTSKAIPTEWVEALERYEDCKYERKANSQN